MSKEQKRLAKLAKLNMAVIPVSTLTVSNPLAIEAGQVLDTQLSKIDVIIKAVISKLTSIVAGMKDIQDKTALENKKYFVLFSVCQILGIALEQYGTKRNRELDYFPLVGAVTLYLSDCATLYNKLGKLHIDVQGGYIHYVNNVFHFFKLEEKGQYPPKEKEIEILATLKGTETTPDATTPDATTPDATKTE